MFGHQEPTPAERSRAPMPATRGRTHEPAARSRAHAPAARPRGAMSARARLVVLAVIAVCAVAGGSFAAYAASLTGADYAWYNQLGGKGAASGTTYTITTAQELRAFSNLVNGQATYTGADGNPVTLEQDSFEGDTVVLAPANNGTGIALNASLAGADVTDYEFTPIGADEAHAFQGTFEGNGKSISGLQITEYNASNAGLFGVVGEQGAVQNLSVSGTVSVAGVAAVIENVGGVVGQCNGVLANCSANVNVTVSNALVPTVDTPTIIKNVGGVVGAMNNVMTGCVNTGSLTIENGFDAVVDENNNALPVAQCIGGVAGLLGSDEAATTGVWATGCTNAGSMYLSFTGLGGKDRFGQQVISKAAAVGGIAGYSSGSIVNCANTGELRTSTYAEGGDAYGYDTTFDNGGMQVGGIVGNLRDLIVSNHFSTDMDDDAGSKDNVIEVRNCYNTGLVIGSNAVGGIVGCAGTYTLITECANGNYTANNTVVEDNADDKLKDPHTQGAVVCTRWNKPFAGGIAGTTVGSITYCSNRAQINNTQAGFYLAGICGALGSDKLETLDKIKEDPSYQSEMHSCWNSGQIGVGHVVSEKYGALLGTNEGYVHDCVVLEGCVITGFVTDEDGISTGEVATGSDIIGDAAWKDYRNISVLSKEDLQTSGGLAILNAYAQADNGFEKYWFNGKGTAENGGNYNDGFPVLTTWAQPYGATDLGTVGLTQITEEPMAAYSATSDPVPSVSLGTADGTLLVQNVDYVIIAQPGARDMTVDADNTTPYQYSVRGIGRYCGTLENFGAYGIGAGSMENMTVQVSSPKFNWEVQLPSSVKVIDAAGNEVASDQYSYVVYDSATNNLTSIASSKYVAYDSKGFLSFDGGATLLPAEEYKGETTGKAFIIYDREGRKIADSDGLVYDPASGECITGRSVNYVSITSGSSTVHKNVVGGAGLMNYKVKQENTAMSNDCDAGYVVEVTGEGSYAGSSTTGRYIIRPASLAQDCQTTVFYDGKTYVYDVEKQCLFLQNEDGTQSSEKGMTAVFTGESIKPEISLSYLGVELVEDLNIDLNPDRGVVDGNLIFQKTRDYCVVYGPVNTEVLSPLTQFPNRDAFDREVSGGNREDLDNAAVSARFSSCWNSRSSLNLSGVRCFDNYVSGQFSIAGRDLSDCSVHTIDQAQPAEGTVFEPVQVTLDTEVIQSDGAVETVHSVLEQGVDYELSYADENGVPLVDAEGNPTQPTELGSYQVVVTPKEPNLHGEAQVLSFNIVEAQTFTVDDIPDTTWNVDNGGKITPQVVVKNEQGDDLEYGVDYTYEITLYLDSQPYQSVWTGEPLPYVWWNECPGEGGYYSAEHIVKIIGLGSYAGCEIEKTWKIKQLDLATTDPSDWTINPNAVRMNEMGFDRLNGSASYSLLYKGFDVGGTTYGPGFSAEATRNGEAVHAGDEVTLVLSALGSSKSFFSGSIVLDNQTFTVRQTELAEILSWYADQVCPTEYTGEPIEPISIRYLVEGEDYEIKYAEDHTNVGTVSYTVTGMGDFTGTRSGSFQITPRTLSAENGITLDEIPEQAYTGQKIKPTVVVHDGDKLLVEGVDYTVSYGGNVQSEGVVYVKGMGNYVTPTGKELVAKFPIVMKEGEETTGWEGVPEKDNWIECVFSNVVPSHDSRATLVVYQGSGTFDAIRKDYVESFALTPSASHAFLLPLFTDEAIGQAVLDELGLQNDSPFETWLETHSVLTAEAADVVPGGGVVQVGSAHTEFSSEMKGVLQNLYTAGVINLDAKYQGEYDRAMDIDTTLNAVVVPYDLSADASSYAALSEQLIASALQGDGTGSVTGIPHGVSITVNGGNELIAVGEPLDIQVQVKDAFGSTIPSSEYRMRLLRNGVEVSEVKDSGTYVVEVTGLASGVDAAGYAVGEFGNYMGTATATFQVASAAEPDPMAGHWVSQSGGWWYSLDLGGWPVNQWAFIDGAWYRFDASGWMQTGWVNDGGTWYYLRPSGAMATGWLSWGGAWYYLGPEGDGAMRTGWFQDETEIWYYADASGVMLTGWLKDGGSWYYLASSGAMSIGWIWDGAWYFMQSSGAMATGWFEDGDAWYYADDSGAMVHDRWVGNYWLTSSGAMATSAWVDGGRYYVGADGAWVPGA